MTLHEIYSHVIFYQLIFKYYDDFLQRLPHDVEILGEFTGYMYFSPLTPTSTNGTPAEDIHYVHLNIKRSGKLVKVRRIYIMLMSKEC